MALANELGLTSKVVSERHYVASLTMLTAGHAAKIISKAVSTKVSAKEVKELYRLHYGCGMEWHHSGFYQGATGQTMGRTYFISPEETQEIIENFSTLYIKLDKKKRCDEEVIYAFYWEWKNIRSKRNPQWSKVLKTYYGVRASLPKNSTECDLNTYLAAKNAEGRVYSGWSKPLISDFTT